MVAQLREAEGFSSGEEVDYVDAEEISTIEGFDEETADELQARAREFLEKEEKELDEERRQLGVADELRNVDGITTAMMVVLGKEDIKSLEDFAGCAVDDLCGWTERKDGEVQRFEGILKDFKVSRAEAEAMIMQARILAGWVTEEELMPEPEMEDEAVAAEGEAGEPVTIVAATDEAAG